MEDVNADENFDAAMEYMDSNGNVDVARFVRENNIQLVAGGKALDSEGNELIDESSSDEDELDEDDLGDWSYKHLLADYPHLQYDDGDLPDDELPDGAQGKLFRISPIYWAAKPMLCSTNLKEHIRSSASLTLAMEKRGITYEVLRRMCITDQAFALNIDKNDGLLADLIQRLKADGARDLFSTTCHETLLLKLVSSWYENRVDLIEGKTFFLSALLKDLRKDDAKLRLHEVEVSFLFACMRDDAARFLDQLPTWGHPRVGDFNLHTGSTTAMIKYMDEDMMGAMGERMRGYVQTFLERMRPVVVENASSPS